MSFSIEDPGFLKRGRRNARTGKKNRRAERGNSILERILKFMVMNYKNREKQKFQIFFDDSKGGM